MPPKTLIASCLIAVSSAPFQTLKADELDSYISSHRNFLEIEDVNREAESWATCAATFDIMAQMYSKTHPARSQQLANYANGSELAVAMSIVADGMDSSKDQSSFSSLWAMAKLSHSELPKVAMNMILADGEQLREREPDKFIGRLIETFKICTENMEAQQAYIDSWRALAKSGVLQLPNE